MGLWRYLGRRTSKGKVIRIPPAALRKRVSSSDEGREYLVIGSRTVGTLYWFLARNGYDLKSFARVLDFACGCGRTLNFMQYQLAADRLFGCDSDPQLVEWCQRHLSATVRTIKSETPPTEFPGGYFDFIYSISFFTHSTEESQKQWLAEWSRILKPDGVVVVSLHGRRLASQAGVELVEGGFAYKIEGPEFNQRTAYQDRHYVEREWIQIFDVIDYQELGLNHHQDLVLLGGPRAKARKQNLSPPNLPRELQDVYLRRPDLQANFDDQGLGRPGTPWVNLSLLEWALFDGGYQLPALRHLAFDAIYRTVDSEGGT